MTLSDTQAYRQVIGCLMYKPLLFLEYPDIRPRDFDFDPAKICLLAIKKLYEAGAASMSVMEVDQEILRSGGSAPSIYTAGNGLNFLKEAYEHAQLGNFDVYYKRLKKNSLLRQLKAAHYDISEYFIEDKNVTDPLLEATLIAKLESATIDEILNSVEKHYNEIRNEFTNGKSRQGNPAEGLTTLIDELKKSPSIGPSLEGKIFSSICRGAREGCFFLKSASTSAGKSRTSIFDACHLAYPKRWSHELNDFVEEIDASGEPRQPRKVLFIVTEMDKEELQTIMLAYLSGIDEDTILRGAYATPMEEHRVRNAAKIMEEYSGYFLIEEIADPNLQNVQSTIKKYATVDDVKYVFFDYIHSTASMIGQFSKNNIREDVILMMMANQLKQIAKDYKIFIFSATQVNALGISDDEMEFKDEKCIRGAKSIADKCDMGYVMTRISDKAWDSLRANLKPAVRDGTIPSEYLEDNYRPTHVLDIYKMRRGRYKMIRIWTHLHLGTGYRKDLFITNAMNQPMNEPIDLFSSNSERIIKI
jgi:replicative DNA helicase